MECTIGWAVILKINILIMGASFQDYRGLIQSHIIDDIIKTDPKLKRMLNKTYETPFKHCLLVAYFKK